MNYMAADNIFKQNLEIPKEALILLLILNVAPDFICLGFTYLTPFPLEVTFVVC